MSMVDFVFKVSETPHQTTLCFHRECQKMSTKSLLMFVVFIFILILSY